MNDPPWPKRLASEAFAPQSGGRKIPREAWERVSSRRSGSLRPRTVCPICVAVVCGLCFLSSAHAQLPAPRFDRLQPLGANAGTSIEVDVSGRDTEDVASLWFDHPGLKSELLKPGRFKIAVAADVPEGTYDVRLVGRFGVSNSRLLAVSQELIDVAEVEPNNRGGESQVVPINSAINAVCDGDNQDCFRFAAKQGQRVSVDCQAMQLDSSLDGNLILSTTSGEILAASGDYFGRDPFVDFLPPADGEYVVTVHDLSYRGGFPYRLLITTRPHVENVFPRAVAPGSSVELRALGRNLSQGQPSSWKLGGLTLDEFRFPFTAPGEAAGTYTFRTHPTDHGPLPTAATRNLDGLQVRVPSGAGGLRPVPIVLAQTPVAVDAEPNSDRKSPQRLELPVTLSGRFDEPRDADWFEIESAEAGTFVVEVLSEQIGGRADPFVVLYDDKDNRLTEFDDAGPRANAFDGYLRDPQGQFSLEAKRKYRLLVQDRYGRGGARYQYVLVVRKPSHDFSVTAIHSENPGPAGTNLWRGGAAYLDLMVHAHDQGNSPVTITAENLPPGVHAAPTVINVNTRGPFVLWADRDAPLTAAAPIKLRAVREKDGQTTTREVRPFQRVWAEANVSSSRPTRQLTIGVVESAPWSLAIEPPELTVESGKKANLKVVLTRHTADVTGAVTVLPLDFFGYFNLGTNQIAAGQTEVVIAIDVQAGARPGKYTLALLGQSQVPYAKDPQATSKPNLLVSMPSRPVTLTIVAPKK